MLSKNKFGYLFVFHAKSRNITPWIYDASDSILSRRGTLVWLDVWQSCLDTLSRVIYCQLIATQVNRIWHKARLICFSGFNKFDFYGKLSLCTFLCKTSHQSQKRSTLNINFFGSIEKMWERSNHVNNWMIHVCPFLYPLTWIWRHQVT